jgi:hypothetical protein
MGLSSILGFALPISHLVCSIVFVGCLQFTANGTDCEGAAITVGYGLFMIVALQYLSVSFFTRNVRNEEPSSISKIFWFIFAGSTL